MSYQELRLFLFNKFQNDSIFFIEPKIGDTQVFTETNETHPGNRCGGGRMTWVELPKPYKGRAYV